MKSILEVTNKFSSSKLKDVECLAYLIKVATANAQRLEEQTKLIRKKSWNTHGAGTGGECARGAYQYAKGPIGS